MAKTSVQSKTNDYPTIKIKKRTLMLAFLAKPIDSTYNKKK